MLLDEPFASLDPNLRAQIRAEVVELLRATGTPAVFVTHDQTEALATGDRVAVMRAGRHRAARVADRRLPRAGTRFVAGFMGDASFLPVAPRRRAAGDRARRARDVPVGAGSGWPSPCARPEDVTFELDADGPAEIVAVEFRGPSWHVHAAPGVGHGRALVAVAPGAAARRHAGAAARWSPGTGWSPIADDGRDAERRRRRRRRRRAVRAAGRARRRPRGASGRAVRGVGRRGRDGGAASRSPASASTTGATVSTRRPPPAGAGPPRRAARCRPAGAPPQRPAAPCRALGAGSRCGPPDLVALGAAGRRARRIAADLVAAAAAATRGDDSYAEFVRAGLGPTVLATFHGRWPRSCGVGRPTDLSAELARRRIAVNDGSAAAAQHRSRLAAGRAHVPLPPARDTARSSIASPTPPRRPASTIIDDGRRSSAGSSRVAHARSRSTTAAPSRPDACCGRRRSESLATVVGGAPAPRLAHRGLVLVYLALDEDRYSEVDAHYVPDAEVAFARLSEPKNYRIGTRSGRSHRAVRRGAGDRRRRRGGRPRTRSSAPSSLDGMAGVGLRRPTPSGVAVRRLPRVYPLLGIGDDGTRRVTGLGRRAAGRHRARAAGAARRRQPAPRLDMALAAVGCLGDDGWDERALGAERRRFDDVRGRRLMAPAPVRTSALVAASWRCWPRSSASTPGRPTAPGSPATSRSTC